jgi:hypothetical protein
VTTVFQRVAGKRHLYRPPAGTTDAAPPVGIARAIKGDVALLEKSFAKYCGKRLTKGCCGKPAMAQFKMGIQIHSNDHRLPGRGLGGGSISLGYRQLA